MLWVVSHLCSVMQPCRITQASATEACCSFSQGGQSGGQWMDYGGIVFPLVPAGWTKKPLPDHQAQSALLLLPPILTFFEVVKYMFMSSVVYLLHCSIILSFLLQLLSGGISMRRDPLWGETVPVCLFPLFLGNPLRDFGMRQGTCTAQGAIGTHFFSNGKGNPLKFKWFLPNVADLWHSLILFLGILCPPEATFKLQWEGGTWCFRDINPFHLYTFPVDNWWSWG